MSAVAELIDVLIARGMEAGEAASLVARAGAEISSSVPSKGAVRTRRWRANRASQSVTERHAVTPEEQPAEASQSVTKRHKASPGDNALLLTSSDSELKIDDQEKKVRGPRKARASPLPAGWVVPARAKSLAEELGVDLEPTVERFRDYLASSGKLYADYDAGFCNFVRNTPKFNGAMKNGGTAWKNTRQPSPITAALNKHLERFERQARDGDEVRDPPPRLLSNG